MATSNQSFTIDKVQWHTQTPGNTESTEHIHRRFKSIISFLQENRLTIRLILPPDAIIADSLTITSGDLTEDGLAIMRKCYDRWLKKVDHGKPPEDMSMFENALATLKGRGEKRSRESF